MESILHEHRRSSAGPDQEFRIVEDLSSSPTSCITEPNMVLSPESHNFFTQPQIRSSQNGKGALGSSFQITYFPRGHLAPQSHSWKQQASNRTWRWNLLDSQHRLKWNSNSFPSKGPTRKISARTSTWCVCVCHPNTATQMLLISANSDALLSLAN